MDCGRGKMTLAKEMIPERRPSRARGLLLAVGVPATLWRGVFSLQEKAIGKTFALFDCSKLAIKVIKLATALTRASSSLLLTALCHVN